MIPSGLHNAAVALGFVSACFVPERHCLCHAVRRLAFSGPSDVRPGERRGLHQDDDRPDPTQPTNPTNNHQPTNKQPSTNNQTTINQQPTTKQPTTNKQPQQQHHLFFAFFFFFSSPFSPFSSFVSLSCSSSCTW